MKKLFMLVAVLAASFTLSMAQDARAIYENFCELSGVNNYVGAREGASELLQATMETQGMVMPIKVISKHSEPKKYRAEMTMGDQNITVIYDGESAYLNMAGEVQQITDPAVIEQLVPDTDVASQLGPQIEDFSKLTIVSQEKGKTTLKYEDETESYTMTFNDKTGLLESSTVLTTVEGQEVKVKSDLKKYKKFSDDMLYFPSEIKIEVMGQKVTMTFEEIELNYPTAPWMFAAPKM
ncbi:MAG: DUF4292 domain-containing protein [Rikenellaceae bacterium]